MLLATCFATSDMLQIQHAAGHMFYHTERIVYKCMHPVKRMLQTYVLKYDVHVAGVQ